MSNGRHGAIAMAAVVVLAAAAVALAWPRGATAPVGFPCLAVPDQAVREVLGLTDAAALSSDNAAGRTSVDGHPVVTVVCERTAGSGAGKDGAEDPGSRQVRVEREAGTTQVRMFRDGVEVTIDVARPLDEAGALRLAADWDQAVAEVDSDRPGSWLFVTAFVLPLLLLAAGRIAGDLVERDVDELSTPLRLLVSIGSLEVGLGAGLSRMAALLPDSWSQHPDQKHPRHDDFWPPR